MPEYQVNTRTNAALSNHKAMIPVTAAIIEKNGLILTAQRGVKVHLGGYWEFPGGKIERGETPEECLKRELAEEFSIQCKIGSFLTESIYDYGHKVIQLLGYRAYHIDGNFQLTDHDKICWLPVERLFTLKWAPADIPLVTKLQENGNGFPI
jgi:8-oxo-dGTP diphosphatase